MKIRNVRLEDHGPKVQLVADCKIRRVGWDRVYFQFDKKYKKDIVVDATPFAAALLFPSMRHKEDLIIEGQISKKFHDNIQQLTNVVTSPSWNVMRLQKINIKVPETTPDEENPTWNATSFSAGVDSFYTFLKHRTGSNKITHLITVNGFDIDLRNQELWESTIKNIRAVAKEAKVKTIEAQTNIKELIEPMIAWDDSCGGGLAATPLCLRHSIKTFYIPGGFTTDLQYPGGSTVLTDHLFGTEKLKIIHDAEARRVDKIINVVSHSDLALQHLRVCHNNLKGIYNCGQCDKCLRTMVSLTITNSLDRAKTFPKKINLQKIASLKAPPSSYMAVFHRENLNELEKREIHPEIQDALLQALNAKVTDTHMSHTLTLIDRAIYFDHLYTYGTLRKLARPLVGNKF